MNSEELKKILDRHQHWIKEDCDGWEDMRANLYGADLYGANLHGAKGVCLPIACPDTGAFTAWKKASKGEIIQLEIPANARRLSATGRKCRCDKAKVISITDRAGNPVKAATSGYDRNFVYKVGEVVAVDNFCGDRWNECSAGIHFFITREEAEQYVG